MSHSHTAIRDEDWGYTGPVAPAGHENKAAHGNITRIEYCDCGARRWININGSHREVSPWHVA